MEVYKVKNLTAGTQSDYDSAWLRLNNLKDIKIRNIRTAQLQHIINTAETKPSNSSPAHHLSRTMLSKIKVLAVMLWDYAVQNDIIDKNYAQFIVLPKYEKNEKEAFSEIEIKAIEIAAQKGIPWTDVICVMIYTGFRLDEILSLTPFSFDAKEKTLTGGVKTDAGRNRLIPVHKKIMSYVMHGLLRAEITFSAMKKA